MFICLFTILLGIGSFFYFHSYTYVKSTDLAGTSILDLKIGDYLTKSMKKKIDEHYGPEINDPGMAILLNVEYEQVLKYKGLFIATRDSKIVAVVTENKLTSTNKGISPIDSKTKIENVYGQDYTKKSEEIGNTLSYVDKENKIILKFVVNKNNIKQIILSELD